MSLSVAAMRLLEEKGLSLADVIAVAAANEAERVVPSQSAGAARTRKWREKKAAERHGDSHGDAVTVTPPRIRVLDNNPLTEVVLSGSEAKASSPAEPPKREKRGSKRVPVDWLPKPGDLAIADTEGFSPGAIERELAKFRDHQFRDAHTDWDAAFRNWIRRAKPSRNDQPIQPSAKLLARHQNYANSFAGLESVARNRGG